MSLIREKVSRIDLNRERHYFTLYSSIHYVITYKLSYIVSNDVIDSIRPGWPMIWDISETVSNSPYPD